MKFVLNSDYINLIIAFYKRSTKSKTKFYGILNKGRISLSGNYSLFGINVENYDNPENIELYLTDIFFTELEKFIKDNKLKSKHLDISFVVSNLGDKKQHIEMLCLNGVISHVFISAYSNRYDYNRLHSATIMPSDIDYVDFKNIRVNIKLISDAYLVLDDLVLVNKMKSSHVNGFDVVWLDLSTNNHFVNDEVCYGILGMSN